MKHKSTGESGPTMPATVGNDAPTAGPFDFAALVSAIRQLHAHCAARASRAVNVHLTLRNWTIGAYIHHYQLHGSDRAAYGERLIDRLASELNRQKVTACDRQRLYSYLALVRTYPQIGDAVPSDLLPARGKLSSSGESPIVQSLTGEIDQGTGAEIVRSATGHFAVNGPMLLEHLSYTHLEMLTGLHDPLKRAFYEIECIRGNWSVRQLKRQIATLYYERSGMSDDKEKLAAIVQAEAETAEPKLAIRDPYVFEFLGLRAKDAVAETDLEAALVENLRDFLLELGHGFCLEAQQKASSSARPEASSTSCSTTAFSSAMF